MTPVDGREGRVLTRAHLRRERNRELVGRKKLKVHSETGALRCEVCGFDFYMIYGERGAGFAECHHLVPLADLSPDTRTRLTDLAILCANCHRMIHRQAPWLTLDELRQLVTERTG